MDPMTASALISAGSKLIGGLFGSKSASDANKQNIQLQKQFAQQGIQWKVADAKKAGIHPLYALGAQTASFAPSSVGDPLGGAISDMGQDIGRAVDAASTTGDRVANKVLTSLQLERAGLENDLLRSQIATQRAQLGPGFPGSPTLIPGQGDTTMVGPNLQRYTLPKGADPASTAQNIFGEGGEMMYIPELLAQTLKNYNRGWYENLKRGNYGEAIMGKHIYDNYWKRKLFPRYYGK